jgi:allantoin racemase
MILIQVINPNTSRAMTEGIARTAREAAGPGCTVRTVTSPMGPASIESHYDEALAVPGVLAAVRSGELAGADGHVIACFGDPGLAAAREAADGPVVGIAEAAMHTATFLGRSFSVVTTLSRTTGQAWDLARKYGFGAACAGVHACDIPVLDLDSPAARASVAKACAAARDADRCDVLVLGCAGMSGLATELTGELGIPVVDGVAAAVQTAAALVALGLRTSKRDEYAPPPPKPVLGPLSRLAVTDADVAGS